MSENLHGFIYEKDTDGIVTITMDLDGPVNAMNSQYRDAMLATVTRLQAESDLTGVVLASAKSTFFAGGDLRELSSVPKGEEEAQFRTLEDKIKAPLRGLEKLEVPVVAAINGAALGGGLEICLACNYRIALNSPQVQIGLPEVTLGLLPGGGGVVRSIHLLGLEKALPFLLEGKRLNASEAVEVGYVNELVDDADKLVASAKNWIKANPEAWAQPWDIQGHKIPGGDATSKTVLNILAMATPMTIKKTRGLLPAPERILAVAGDTMTVDFDTALRIESRGFAFLNTTAEAKNIITSGFFQMNSVNGGAARPKGIEPSKVKKVGILGAGMMGQGITFSSAMAGIEVVLKDISLEAAEKGKAYTAKLLDKQIQRGRKTEADKTKVLGLIKATKDYADLQGCDLIIEAVFENIELKNNVTKEAEGYLAEGGIYGSNTSTLPISQLAEASAKPENFIGIHFFSPVDKMPLVEIICGEKTSDETLAKAFDYTRQIRKTAIVVNDSLGFFTSRVFFTYLDEGARLLTEGADPVLIDAMGKQVGMPVGPLTIQDEVSQELTRKAAETHRNMGVLGSKSDCSVGIDVCESMVRDFNRGGRHHGGGFYEYAEDGSKAVWPKLYELYHKPNVSIANQDMKDRILFRQVIESLKCLQEGVLRSVAEGNVGSLLGIGAPTWTGGFIQFVNTYEYNNETGPAAFVSRANELAEQYGARFTPPANVIDKAKDGGTFQ
ncbi:enoyl-CoA hydratase/isomerase family protein [Aestuariicella sp. G3-2]|uniref:3-hydroxyacyl-CoA dehydrogenase NAD-binding domain-containing protein n=1 Tax=Pseudomaricurvus albidus TaxID=2842452 RepID=UPI001C0D177F|nr:3-hydroxyacyl-CoA dehydrogenase NAD-binding domain-containing protein [Aestuariicella albida]MBU3071079.1 enoyl-CoA hydratase/isomerase family protein [Aestuariicella albida]